MTVQSREARSPEPPALETLREALGELADLGAASGVLNWDKEVNMPPRGASQRIQQLTTLGQLQHRMQTRDELGEMLESAEEAADDLPDDAIERALVREARRSYDDARKLPGDFVGRMTRLSGEAHEVWVKARENDDYSAFEPYLGQVIELAREMAEYLDPEVPPYDALLDRFERGATSEWLTSIFQETADAIVPLREAIDASGVEIDDSVLRRDYSVEGQKRFARHLAEAVGYDLERGHIGTAVHPFATSFGRDDCRITTRYYPNFISASVFGTLHECGHAMYEQNTAPEFARTPLARGTSMGIHESQSRMVENVVGRSRPFWEKHFGALRETFPEALDGVSLDDWYGAINKVQPSLIRVEADELTYNLHIILRFELEQAMMTGDLTPSDVPAAWNEKMEQLLGVQPPSDREGVLQDVHWTRPMFGYFPTYALGNLYAAQLYEAACADSPTIEAEMAQGRPGELLDWLETNVHQHGKRYPPAEICERATGRTLDHEAFERYARQKFGALYGLTAESGLKEL